MAEPMSEKPRRKSSSDKAQKTAVKQPSRGPAGRSSDTASATGRATGSPNAAGKAPATPTGNATQTTGNAAGSASGARSKPAASAAGMAAELRTLRTERSVLAGELETAKAKIAELEAALTDAVNRIDWVIDSLQTLSNRKKRG